MLETRTTVTSPNCTILCLSGTMHAAFVKQQFPTAAFKGFVVQNEDRRFDTPLCIRKHGPCFVRVRGQFMY